MTLRTPIPEIAGLLGQLRSAIRRLFLVWGLSRGVFVAALLAVVVFALDYFLRLPVGVRLFLTAASLGILGMEIYRELIYPMRLRLGDDDLALCLEERFGELSDRLVTAVELSVGQGDPSSSPVLVKEITRDAVEAVKSLNPKEALQLRYLRRWILLGLLTGGIVTGLAAARPVYASRFLYRMVGGSIDYPRRTYLVLEELPEAIAKGEDLLVEVVVQGVVPSKIWVYYELNSGEEGRERMGRARKTEEDPSTSFIYTFGRVMHDVTLWVEGGDGETATATVRVLPPPALEEIALFYDYPEYLNRTGKLVDTPPDRPEPYGMVDAPVGTQVRILGRVNMPLAENGARLVVIGKTGDRTYRMKLLDENRIEGILDVRENAHYKLELVGENGLEARNPPRYIIHAIPDRAPRVKFVKPGVDKDVTRDASIPMEIGVKDDFAIDTLEFHHRVLTTGAQPDSVPVEVRPLWRAGENDEGHEGAGAELAHKLVLEIGDLETQEGDTILYRAAAADTNDVTGPGVGTSRDFRLRVMSRQNLIRKIEDREQRIRDIVARLVDLQRETRSSTAKLIDIWSGTRSAEEKRALFQVEVNEKRVARKSQGVKEELERLAEDIYQNKLGISRARRYEEMAERMKQVSDDLAPRAAKSIARADKEADAERARSSLGESYRLQGEALTVLRTLLDDLTRWESYAKIREAVRELLESQERVRKETEQEIRGE